MRLNFQTQASRLDQGGDCDAADRACESIRPLEGFSADEADVLAGDELDKVVTWKGKSDLAALKGKQVAVRLYLARAKVFSMAI